MMEKNFCGKCGRLVSECICGDGAAVSAVTEPVTRAGERYENLALAQGETVVRSYKIGAYSKFFGLSGKGTAQMLITNRRVISKQDMRQGSGSASFVEEIALNEVSGVKTYYGRTLDVGRLLIAIAAVIVAVMGVVGTAQTGEAAMLLMTLAGALVMVWMIFTMKKTRYLFTIYTRASSSAMAMSAKMRGKLLRGTNGIVFEYEPTKEAMTMMNEMGACIMDLKTRGSAAIGAWKQA